MDRTLFPRTLSWLRDRTKFQMKLQRKQSLLVICFKLIYGTTLPTVFFCAIIKRICSILWLRWTLKGPRKIVLLCEYHFNSIFKKFDTLFKNNLFQHKLFEIYSHHQCWDEMKKQLYIY